MITLKGSLYNGVLMTIYYSSSASDAEFIGFLENAMEDLMLGKECIVMGVFNIDFMIDSFYKRKLQDLMHNIDIQQYVKRPMRITESSRSLIDLIFSNKEVEVNVLNEPKVTNHVWLEVGLQPSGASDKYREYTARNFSEFSMDRFVELVRREFEYNRGQRM